MQYRRNPVAATLVAAFLVPVAYQQPAHAQTTAAAQEVATDQALPSVNVTASADASAEGVLPAYAGGQVARGGRVGFLGNQDARDTPFSTTSYTQEFIKDQQARSVGDVLMNDPTVRVTRGFGNYQEAYMIRGFIVDSDALAFNGLYGILPRQFAASEMFERVEIFRGASAFLNGATPSGAGIGGTINLLPKRAASVPVEQVTAGYESGGQVYLATDIGHRFGPDERIGVRLNAARREGGTAIDGENRELGLVTLGLDYRGNRYRLSADIAQQEYNLNGARPSLSLHANVAVPTAPDASKNFGQLWTTSKERDVFGTVRGEWDLTSETTAWAALGARQGVENNRLASVKLVATAGNTTSSRFDNVRQDTVRTGEIGMRSKFKTGPLAHAVSATASAYRQASRNAYAMLFAAPATPSHLYAPMHTPISAVDYFGGNMAAPKTTVKAQLSSVALADTVSFADDRIAVTLGLRHQTINNTTYDYNTQAETARFNKSALTPVLGLVFKPLQNLSLYANYIEGLEKGTEVTSHTAVNRGQVLSPYRSKQKEIGAKYDAGNVGFGIALFSTAKPIVYENPVTHVFGADGAQRNRGAEFSVFGAPMRGVRLLGGLTVLRATLANTEKGVNDGHVALGVPKTQANLGAEWDVPGLTGLTVNGRITYTSTQYVDAANQQEVPSWNRYDIGARYTATLAGRTVTLRGALENLTNKNYWASAGSGDANGYLVLGAPRTLVVSAAVDF